MDDTLYLCLLMHLHSGVFEFTLRCNGADTSMTLDAAKWNGAGGELSSCVMNNIQLDHVL